MPDTSPEILLNPNETDSGDGRKAIRPVTIVIHADMPRNPDANSAGNALRDPQQQLDEIVSLTAAIGAVVVGELLVTLRTPKPATLLTQGALDQITDLAREHHAELLVVNARLTAIQQRNLERKLDLKVLDRTALILEIFGARARTKEGQLQVELAAMTYQKSRLVRSWTHLERQRGGGGFTGGPGESQIELDRRMIADRIVRIKKELKEVRRTRSLHRDARRRVPFPIVALVGYTNAGKSTLFNRLAGAEVFAKDMLFATLDPTLRAVTIDTGMKVLLSDTVGFISDLPHELVEAFRATLEEVEEADLILHVMDASSEDAEAQYRDVLEVLEGLEISEQVRGSIVTVANKLDGTDPGRLEQLRAVLPDTDIHATSALTGEGVSALAEAISERLRARQERRELMLNWASDGAAISWLYQNGKVDELDGSDAEEGAVHLSILLGADKWGQFGSLFGASE